MNQLYGVILDAIPFSKYLYWTSDLNFVHGSFLDFQYVDNYLLPVGVE